MAQVRIAGQWVSSAELKAAELLALQAEREGRYSAPRDAVTGEPLTSDEYQARLTLPADADGRARPNRIHVHRPAPCRGPVNVRKYWHGGPEWAPEWLAYIGEQVPAEVQAERDQRASWWTSSYACKVVAREMGERSLHAILAWKAEGLSYHVVTRKYAKGRPGWVDRQYRRATKLVHREVFDPPRPTRTPRPYVQPQAA